MLDQNCLILQSWLCSKVFCLFLVMLLLARNADKFDVSLLKAAAALFPGTRDFRTFMGRRARSQPDISTIREMYKLDVTPGTPLLGAEYCSSCSHYNFWDITCQARSFLYRQVMCICYKPKSSFF
jgi:tRNA U38,U39,U40 pseudouridine synthase TruA